MVGFGAGQSTFGWIFYPRLQTSRGRNGRLWTDLALLLNGRVPDPTGNDQSIEPGQRECTVLIEMPNFIPKIEFITVADWFRTSEAGDGQKSDLEKASVLGRKLVAANGRPQPRQDRGPIPPRGIPDRRGSPQAAQGPHAHPAPGGPGPLQRRPQRFADLLLARLAAPAVAPGLARQAARHAARSRRSSWKGRNFSVHDTHVIAGGKPARSVLVSRNLLEVTIAKDASPTPSANGTPLLDINVATPNGVSNHLLINMAHPDSHRAPPRAKPRRTRRRTRSRGQDKAPLPQTTQGLRNRHRREFFDRSEYH